MPDSDRVCTLRTDVCFAADQWAQLKGNARMLSLAPLNDDISYIQNCAHWCAGKSMSILRVSNTQNCLFMYNYKLYRYNLYHVSSWTERKELNIVPFLWRGSSYEPKSILMNSLGSNCVTIWTEIDIYSNYCPSATKGPMLYFPPSFACICINYMCIIYAACTAQSMCLYLLSSNQQHDRETIPQSDVISN